MAIRSAKNLYPGVNAHLNSFLQNIEGGWQSFHGAFIIDLTRALNAALPPQYEAHNERSLQVREVVLLDDTTFESHRRKPDVTIYGTQAENPGMTLSGVREMAAALPLLPVVETMDIDDEAYLEAVVIYHVASDDEIGRPVTRIELISPANKPPASGYVQYRDKRNQGLQTGIPLVEIDLLHQSRPIVKKLPSYRDRARDAQPYVVVISDPRPSIYEGYTQLVPFGVLDAFPKLDIPLRAQDVLGQFDWGAAYNTTYENTRFYHRMLDYSLPPRNFDAYTADDQHRILNHIQVISAAHP
jgi:hypothetical protein